MREFILRHKVGAATIVAVLVVATVTIYSVPLNPPLGDCFGSLLSQDPLICYVLEQADRQDIIDVETVYDADGVLYFSLKQDEELSSNVYEFFEAKAVEFYDRWPDDVPVLSFYDKCVEHLKPTYRECYLELGALPKSKVYDDIWFHTGGETARRLLPGWATWRQVWPAVAGGASGSSETPTTFDVSDVDMTNLPPGADAAGSVLASRGREWRAYLQVKNPPEDPAELEALKEFLAPPCNQSAVCTRIYDARTDHTTVIATAPSVNPGTPVTFHGPLANATTTIAIRSSDLKAYHADLSSLLPTSASSVSMSSSVNEKQTQAIEVVIIPVKYGPGELARWVEILDRFSTSRGNTIGITGARVDTNRSGGWIDPVWPLDNLGPAKKDLAGEIPSTIRETILVWSFDPQRVAPALPVLLPLLGIPVDAVGVVATEWRGGHTYTIPETLPDRDTAPSPPVRFASAVGVPMPLLLLARNVGAVLVAGGIVALVLRLRRRRAPG